MNNRTLLWVAIGALFLIALYLTFKTSSADVTTIQSTVSAARSAAGASSSGMVGGC